MSTAETPRKLEIDALIASITNINPRIEKHGKEDRLAVDITLYLDPEDGSPESWRDLYAALLDEHAEGDAPVDAANEIAHLLKKVPFAAEYREHVVAFWISTRQLVRWPSAKVHAFVGHPKDGKEGVEFKVSTVFDPDQAECVFEVWGDALRIRVEVQPNQPDLFDGQPADSDAEAAALH